METKESIILEFLDLCEGLALSNESVTKLTIIDFFNRYAELKNNCNIHSKPKKPSNRIINNNSSYIK